MGVQGHSLGLAPMFLLIKGELLGGAFSSEDEEVPASWCRVVSLENVLVNLYLVFVRHWFPLVSVVRQR